MKQKTQRFKIFIGIFAFTILLLQLGVGISLADSPPVPAGATTGTGASTAPTDSASGTQTASGQSAGQSAAQQPGMAGMLMPFLVMFAVVYFIMIRPQQKKMKQHQTMIGGLQHGDEVVTASGILGKVTGITDKVVTIEVAQDVRVKMLKSQVNQVLKGQVKELT